MCGIFFVYKKDKVDNRHVRFFENVAERFIAPRGPTKSYSTVSGCSFRYTSVLSINGNTKHIPDIQYVGELFDLDPHVDEVEYLNNVDPSLFVDNNHDGMYSIVWHKPDSVFMVSDPQGEKRLFYYMDDQQLIVSSVPGAIAALLPHPQVNKRSLERYLSQRHHIVADGCMIDGIYELPRGLWKFNKQTFSFERVKIFDYSSWNVPTADPINTLKQEIDVMKAHEGRSRTVCTISGGIDSSVVAYLRQTDHSIALQFDDKDCASHLSGVLAKEVGSNHSIVNVSINDYARSAVRCIEMMAGVMPTHSMASMHVLGRSLQERGFEILYGGDGADELFLGYPCYHNEQTLYSNTRDVGFAYDRSVTDQLDHMANNRLKLLSMYDYFFQCGSCQFLSADIAFADCGIEYRTPFARRPVAASAFGIANKLLLNNPLGKGPLVSFFKDTFGVEPSKKIGMAGYPNELSFLVEDVIMSEAEQELFEKAKPFFSDRDFQWKVINYKLFKKVYSIGL